MVPSIEHKKEETRTKELISFHRHGQTFDK
jgi:hypothetical protein